MKTSSYILIPATTAGTANENYDGTTPTFSGIPQKAAAYYSKDKSVQTVSWALDKFVGVLTIEATLDTSSDTDNYFPIHPDIGDGVTPLTENDFVNIVGNYTWIRATVTAFENPPTDNFISKVAVGY